MQDFLNRNASFYTKLFLSIWARDSDGYIASSYQKWSLTGLRCELQLAPMEIYSHLWNGGLILYSCILISNRDHCATLDSNNIQ